MGIYGYYLRVSPNELQQALADDGWARRFVDDRLYAPTQAGGSTDERLYAVDKSWNGIFYVLAEAGLPDPPRRWQSSDLARGRRATDAPLP